MGCMRFRGFVVIAKCFAYVIDCSDCIRPVLFFIGDFLAEMVSMLVQALSNLVDGLFVIHAVVLLL